MSKNYLDHFVVDKVTKKARCKLCPESNAKLYSFSENSTTNLKTHLERQHSEDLKKKMEESKQANPFKISAISSLEQKSTTDAVVDLVIIGDEPVSLPEKKWFRKFMGRVKPSWRPICKKTCRAKIIQKGKPFEFKYEKYKKRYGKPSTTVDIWTSRQRLGYMAVTLHLQNKERCFAKLKDACQSLVEDWNYVF
jgi:hypothetical protein